MKKFSTRYRVYYEDTDFSGFVYHARYLHFFERARTDFLRELGLDQSQLYSNDQSSFVVKRMEVDYKRPAKMDDIVVIETHTKEVKGASVIFEQNLFIESNLYVSAIVQVAFIRYGKPIRLPPNLIEKIS